MHPIYLKKVKSLNIVTSHELSVYYLKKQLLNKVPIAYSNIDYTKFYNIPRTEEFNGNSLRKFCISHIEELGDFMPRREQLKINNIRKGLFRGDYYTIGKCFLIN